MSIEHTDSQTLPETAALTSATVMPALAAAIHAECGYGPDEPPMSDVRVAVVHLLNVAVPLDGCRMCGLKDEEHTAACPVPALEQWINPTQ